MPPSLIEDDSLPQLPLSGEPEASTLSPQRVMEAVETLKAQLNALGVDIATTYEAVNSANKAVQDELSRLTMVQDRLYRIRQMFRTSTQTGLRAKHSTLCRVVCGLEEVVNESLGEDDAGQEETTERSGDGPEPAGP